MPRKLAIIEIETGEDERLCSDKCAFIAFGNHCGLFEERLVSDGKERPVRCPQCLESTRLASLDRAVEIQPAPTSAGEAVAAGWVARAGDFVSGVRIGDVCLPNPTRVSGTISEFFNFGDKPVAKLMPGVNDGYIVALDSLKPISPPQAARYSCDKCGLPLNSLTLAGSKLCGDCDAELERECGGSLKPDPYARITVAGTESDRLFAIEENIRSHRMQSEDATLDRLAAARRAKLAQTKQAMDRPAVERHPAPSSMASSRGVVFGPLGEKQFHRSARRYWKRDEGHPVTWPEGSCDDV